MTSDEERRNIAASLRESRYFISGLPKTSLEQNAFDTFERILACVDYKQGNIFDYLADLIDRPTCRNEGDEWGFLCSECGEDVSITKEIPCGGACAPYLPSYCPNCGAVIADD